MILRNSIKKTIPVLGAMTEAEIRSGLNSIENSKLQIQAEINRIVSILGNHIYCMDNIDLQGLASDISSIQTSYTIPIGDLQSVVSKVVSHIKTTASEHMKDPNMEGLSLPLYIETEFTDKDAPPYVAMKESAKLQENLSSVLSFLGGQVEKGDMSKGQVDLRYDVSSRFKENLALTLSKFNQSYKTLGDLESIYFDAIDIIDALLIEDIAISAFLSMRIADMKEVLGIVTND